MSSLVDIKDRSICIIEEQLYFYSNKYKPTFTSKIVRGVKILNFDSDFIYQGYNRDFGPVDVACITSFCKEIQASLRKGTMVIHHTSNNPKICANQALMMAAYLIICHNQSAKSAWSRFRKISPMLLPYCDSGQRVNAFQIGVLDVLMALELAIRNKLYNYNSFNCSEYNRLNRLDQGDLNWILPGKIMAMSSPSTNKRDGCLKPSFFFPIFRYHRVCTVIRLNEKMYPHNAFEDEGVKVVDMEYPDGSNPYDQTIVKFINICDKEISGGRAIAVHCRAGLGRTGTLIGLYMMYKFGWDAVTTIAWLRLCRPGSVVGDQQQFMESMENSLSAIMTRQPKQREEAPSPRFNDQNTRYKFSQKRPAEIKENYEASPTRRQNYMDKSTPVKRQNKKKQLSSSSDKSSDSEKEEIDGNSYIKQYYMRKYGSAKKGFNPEKQIIKHKSSEKKVQPAIMRTPLQPKRLNFYNQNENENPYKLAAQNRDYGKSPQGTYLQSRKKEHQSLQRIENILYKSPAAPTTASKKLQSKLVSQQVNVRKFNFGDSDSSSDEEQPSNKKINQICYGSAQKTPGKDDFKPKSILKNGKSNRKMTFLERKILNAKMNDSIDKLSVNKFYQNYDGAKEPTKINARRLPAYSKMLDHMFD